MTDQLATTAAGVVVLSSTALGSKVFPAIATATGMEIPAWTSVFLGPLGALAAMLFAVWWLAGRLNKAEAKADKREDERDADRKSMIIIIEQNSQVIKEVKEVIGKCKSHQ